MCKESIRISRVSDYPLVAMSTNLLRQSLLTKLDQLPDTEIANVLSYVSFLLYQQNQKAPPINQLADNPVNPPDPLQSFIGQVSHGSLSENIDGDAYS